MAPQKPPSPEQDTSWSALLRPGLGLKRWLAAGVLGTMLIGIGLGVFIRSVFGAFGFTLMAHWLTLGFLPGWLRAAVFFGGGMLAVTLSLNHVRRILVTQLWPESQAPASRELAATLMRRQQRRFGPKIVAIGGGTGMPQLLRGLRAYSDNLTAIVTVADDGGSSGRLRQQMGMLPPGDFRNNIAALSESEGLMKRLFQYRFAESDLGDPSQASELAGHSFGNLFITTMAAVTGSFEAAVAESSKVLRVRGRVLPSTLENVTLCAEVRRRRPDGADAWLTVEGESKLGQAGGQIERVYLKPEHARGYPEAIRAILQADLIVAGPGSFFTSVMPNLLVEAVRDAIRSSQALRIYICNVATQAGETDGYSVIDHMRKLREHADDAFTTVLANDNYDPQRPPSGNSQWVTLPEPGAVIDFRLYTGDVVDEARPWRHDAGKLAARVMAILAETQQVQANPS